MNEKQDLATVPKDGDGQVVQSTYIKPQARKLHDPDVTFEEHVHPKFDKRDIELTVLM